MIKILYDRMEEFKLCKLPPKVLANPNKYNLGHTEKELKDLKLSYSPGKFYFCKNPYDIKNLLNELIGMYYAKLLGARTVEYTMKKRSNEDFYKDNVFLVSENFWNSNCIKTSSLIVPNTEGGTSKNKSGQKLIVMDLSNIINDLLIEDIMKLTSIYLVMRQDDCHEENCYFTNESGIIRLGKLYDYENAYKMGVYNYTGPLMYSNPFLDVEISEAGLQELMIRFPVAYSVFKSLMDIDYQYILSEIEKNYPIEISDDYKVELENKDEDTRKIIRKIL